MNKTTSKSLPKLIVMMDGVIWMADCGQLTMEPSIRSSIRTTMANDIFETYGRGLCDPGRLEASLVGPIEFHELKGSNGWTRLIELGIAKSVDQQVKSALESFSSESGSEHHRITDFVSSALSSLQADVEKASAALKRQKKRAKRYLSASAHGLAGKPKKSPLLTALERGDREIARRLAQIEARTAPKKRTAAKAARKGRVSNKRASSRGKWTANLGKRT